MFLKNLNNFILPDHVIIGSGPAGITLALELERKGIKSLIIEAGDRYVTEGSQKLYQGTFVGENYFDLEQARLRCLGGSSGHWGGNCRPLSKIDFKNWPIKYEDIYKYERLIHRILNLNFNEKYKNENSFSKNLKIINFKQSDVNFAEKYESHINKSNKIFLLLNSPLISMNVSEVKRDKIHEIIILENNIKINKLNVNKLILACGGIENSRLLLWSKEKHNIENLKRLPIGKFWSDHPGGPIGQLVTKRELFEKNFKDKIFEPYNFYLKNNNLNNLRLRFIETHKSLNKFDQIIKDLLCYSPNVGKKIFEKIQTEKMLYCDYVISFSAEQRPNVDNYIFLSKKRDSLGVPKVNLKWKIRSDVYETLQFVLKDLGKELINLNLGRIGIDQNVFNNNFSNSDKIYANYHHMGGTVMGTNNKESVVDKNLRVHNFENLFITGSSVFPSIGHANPTYTIVGLSIRLAEHLSKL